MKYFHINNILCAGCGQCGKVCPTGAIYAEDGRKYIDYGKCNSCGECLKACVNDAVGIESPENMIRKMEAAELYLTRVRKLEKELTIQTARAESAETAADIIIKSLPVASVLLRTDGTIISSNKKFRVIAGADPSSEDAGKDSLAGQNISIFPDITLKRLITLSSGDHRDRSEVLDMAGKTYSVDVVELSKETIMVLATCLDEGTTAEGMVTDLLRDTIQRKMEMVQKIGTLLGDEASAAINDLNNAIGILEASARNNRE